MKLFKNPKILVKIFNENCMFSYNPKGDWIDLRASKNVLIEAANANTLHAGRTKREVDFNYYEIPLGIGMQLPEGYEAPILPRSSSFKKYGFIMANSKAIIDHTYSGPNDEWQLLALGIKSGVIQEGDRVCQFRIQLSQKATIWQKIKWLFSKRFEFEFVQDYEGVDRGGIGSTGTK
jgi:dUTP pyrophosphatase